MLPIELLAPARNADCGIEAIRHGADAVYIGGPDFGARAAAGNSVEDIARLCDFAHGYGARIYVTLNTILWDSELKAAEALVWKLYRAGVDALIVQDLALLEMNLPPIALHASTQMDNCTPEKAQWLEAAGFRQIVLARETPLEEIRAIAQTVKVPVEVFVHGALCVSYSGRCYASQHCFNRSANRGCCAQFCRLAFDLVDGKDRVLVQNAHLLSLRDMNRSQSIDEILDAGVRSFKIEGRLKDTEYVKNVTAYYRRALDEALERRLREGKKWKGQDLGRASYGKSELSFRPQLERSFNRGFTEYFLHGRTERPVANFTSPKAMGALIGHVGKVRSRSFQIELTQQAPSPITAGDGLCFIDRKEGTLQGFRVNRAEGNEVFPNRMPHLVPGMKLYRSLDFAFNQQLAKPTARRTLQTDWTLRETAEGFAIDVRDESGTHISRQFAYPHEVSRSPQRAAIERQLSKLGDTPYVLRSLTIDWQEERFIPASQLAAWRRDCVETLQRAHRMNYQRDYAGKVNHELLTQLTPERLDFTANVANHLARKFYTEHGTEQLAPAFELEEPRGALIMTCKHCIRKSLHLCKKEDRSVPDPLFLRLPDGRRFPLQFDCRRCEMKVYAEKD